MLLYMIYSLPRSLYDEALETYEYIRPVTVGLRSVKYNLERREWNYLIYMARCHLEGQVLGADEASQRRRCKRFLRQLEKVSI
jgi:hypothetical protein